MISIAQVLSVCVIIWCLVVHPVNAQTEQRECRTPHKQPGTCISVRKCKTMIDFLRSIKSKTPKLMEILKGYECGYEAKYVKVCCPDKPIPQDDTSNTNSENEGNNVNTEHRTNLDLLPQNCGPVPGIYNVIGGTITSLFEFPWMALLQYETESGPDFRCGGTVITDRYILTAAHCITNLSNLRLIGVRCGEHNISSPIDCEKDNSSNRTDTKICAPPVQDMEIGEIIPHPDYKAATYSNDIGLIRLATPLNMSVASVKPICLPTETSLQNLNFTSTKLTVTGWGTTEEGRTSAVLRKVDIEVVSPERCQRTYARVSIPLSNRQMCAGGSDRKDSCSGDSGGPLQRIDVAFNDARFVQHGIVSFGTRRCGHEGYPVVYTRTDSYLNWIIDNIKS